jgi:type IV fimbrial biogenesis protein FimT
VNGTLQTAQRCTLPRVRERGFTLMELMIVIVLAALMATLGVPAYRVQVLNSQMTSNANDLLATFHSARSEAVGRQNFITACPRNAAGDDCSGSAWEAGWILFEDSNGDGAVDTGETVLYDRAGLTTPGTIRGTSQIATGVTFRPNGTTDLSATQTLIVCDDRGFGADARGIIITVVGHTSSLAATDTAITTCTP